MYQSAESLGQGMGWLRDYPDLRDFGPQTDAVAPLIARTKAGKAASAGSVDLRQWCSPVEDQGRLGSCTANAGVGIIEYFERRAFGKHLDASRLFLYKVTRNLLGWTGDTGAFLRTTMGALTLFGVPPEKYHPYVVTEFDQEPSPFCYAFAQSYQAIKYYRLDKDNLSKDDVLNIVKNFLASGFPSIFGFTVYDSYRQADATGKLPMPARGEKVVGGHAVVAVGYDDAKQVQNATPGGPKSKGALLIRNSWGAGWGEKGYGWLPYDYILAGLATDFWSLVKSEWVDTGEFD